VIFEFQKRGIKTRELYSLQGGVSKHISKLWILCGVDNSALATNSNFRCQPHGASKQYGQLSSLLFAFISRPYHRCCLLPCFIIVACSRCRFPTDLLIHPASHHDVQQPLPQHLEPESFAKILSIPPANIYIQLQCITISSSRWGIRGLGAQRAFMDSLEQFPRLMEVCAMRPRAPDSDIPQ
jgi:hypothetical protein